MKSLGLLLCALFCLLLSHGQTHLDSLWSVWSDPSLPDTVRLKAIDDFVWDGYLYTQPDSAFYFAGLQLAFAEKKGLKKEMATALNTQGVSYRLRSLFAQAINCYTRSLKLRQEIGDRKGVANSLNNVSIIYYQQGNYAQAIDFGIRSLKIYEEIDDKKGTAKALTNIGNIYSEQRNFPQALEYFKRGLRLNEEINDPFGIALSLNNMGNIYGEQENHDMAIDHFERSLKIDEALGNQNGIATSLVNLGNIYQDLGENEKALYNYQRSLEIRTAIGDEQGVGTCLNNIGTIYHVLGQYSKANDFSRRSLVIAQNTGSLKDIKLAAMALWKTYKSLGRYRESLAMHELYVNTRDSLDREANKKEVIRQEYKYAYEKQAATDSIANAKEKEIQQVQIEKQNAQLSAQRNRQYALFGGLTLALIFAGILFNRFRLTSRQKQIIEKQKNEVDLALDRLAMKNKEITDSIQYAKRIQSAILPRIDWVKEHLPDSFILYRPKDIVAGDFYWVEVRDEKVYFAACDCTGHGVPGAMVSVVCNNALNRALNEFGKRRPGEIFDTVRELVLENFEKSDEVVQDGMDASLASWDFKNKKLLWAGANNPLWIYHSVSNEIEEFKADKQPIGKGHETKPFTTREIELMDGDIIYLFTDGFHDQFGGDKGKKMTKAKFRLFLPTIAQLPMEDQCTALLHFFDAYRGAEEQVDDVCILGVRV